MSNFDQAPSRAEQLTNQFYAWEKRGRGWQVWETPVELEPPFRPFWFHGASEAPVVDDARTDTPLSAWAGRVKERLQALFGLPVDASSGPAVWEPEETEPFPDVFSDDSAVIELAVALRPDQIVSRDAMEQFVLSLHYAHAPIAFEVIGLSHSIRVQFACRERDANRLRQQLRSYFPNCAVREENRFLQSVWRGKNKASQVIDFGLSHEFMLPIRTYRSFGVDPLIAIAGAISELDEGELVVFQVLLQEARWPWTENALRAVRGEDAESFFSDAPDLVEKAMEKLSRPLYAAVVRVAAQSPTILRTGELIEALAGALAQFAVPTGNSLAPLTNENYPDYLHVNDLLQRQSHRSGMLLNVDELVSFMHPPSASVKAERLEREARKTKAAPTIALGHGLILGKNTHNGKTVTVSVDTEARMRHMYVIGASGTGKTTLLLEMILQDIAQGNGFAVLDPHGDLIDRILGHIPEERSPDVVLLDPSDEAYPVGFNILSAHSELEKNLLSSDLVSIFRRFSTTWGDQMTSVLGNAVLAFLESDRGGTLADLRRFLIEPGFREQFLRTVKDAEVVYYWQYEFPLLTGMPQAPLLTRLDTFLRPKLIRYMVSQKEDRLDFRSIMDRRKIFLAKLAQGAIGEENAYLLGALIVAKLHQMALGRQNIPEAERRPFYLYIDEFHNFITPSIASILSGARKFGLALILSHQELRQVESQDPNVASSVISNPYTRVCFRLGDADAQKLSEGFSSFNAQDLQSLGIGEAIARIERAEYDFNLKTLPLPQVDPRLARERREGIIAHSRERYARPREEVEQELALTRPVGGPVRKEGRNGKRRSGQPAPSMQANGEPRTDVRRQPKPGSATAGNPDGAHPNGDN